MPMFELCAWAASAFCLFTWLAAAWWLGAQKRGRNRKRGFHKQLYIRRRMQ